MLRLATPADLPLIQTVLNDPGNLDKLEGYDDAALRAAMEQPESWIYVWEEAGVWSGFCWLRLAQGAVKVEEFGVLHPGQGVGRRFFEALLDQVTAEHGGHIWLAVAADNAAAIRFYERFGFTQTLVKKAAWARRAGSVADAVMMERVPEGGRPLFAS